MSDHSEEVQDRASIRGKGREILLGSGLANSPVKSGAQWGENAGDESLRDFSPEELIAILDLPDAETSDDGRQPLAPPTELTSEVTPPLELSLPPDAAVRSVDGESAEGEVLVNNASLKQLWTDIEGVRTELLEALDNDRDAVEVYWQDLADARALLLDSRANYARAREIVFRVQTDLKRRVQLRAAVRRYRPWLLGYLILWVAVWVGLVAAEGPVKEWGTRQETILLVSAYLPMLYGLLGGVADGFIRLSRSTGSNQDFEPLDVPSYLVAPFAGAVMGLFVFLLASLANQDLLDGLGSTIEKAAVWILAFIAGLNYDALVRWLSGLVRPGGAD